MTRAPDWEERLGLYLQDRRKEPFAWGQNDCLLFAMGAVEAVTGEDPAASIRGRYHTRKGSADLLRSEGAGTLLKTLDARFDRKKPGFAHRGDLVWFSGSVGVCGGAQGLFVGEERLAEAAGAVMREGLITVPRKLWQKAWAV